MRKLFCILWSILLLMPATGCGKKKSDTPRIWCITPYSVSAEQAMRDILKEIDKEATVTFVPAEDLTSRLSSALERGDAPDVFMTYNEALPDLAENKRIAALDARLSVGHVREDELAENARRACLYQGKPYGVPLFVDAYFLATNRALVDTPPETGEELLAACEKLQAKGCAGFENLSPYRRALLYEGLLRELGGDILNSRASAWAFVSEAGEAALTTSAEALQSAAEGKTALGEGKAAFSVYTATERRAVVNQFPDADIALDPLFALSRLQCVALAMNTQTRDAKRAFRILENINERAEKIAALYKAYSARKDIKPLSLEDEPVVPRISSARPAPDVVGYDALMQNQLPAAIESTAKGVPAATAIQDASKAPLGIDREKSAPKA